MIHLFADRRDAGHQLADRLLELGWHRPPARPDLVLGLARGGVAVAAPVAERLSIPWNVLVVRKIGAPGDRELGVGAICEDGVPLLLRPSPTRRFSQSCTGPNRSKKWRPDPASLRKGLGQLH